MEFSHISVLLNEAVTALNIKPNGIYIDGTTGGTGHSKEIAKRLTENGMLLALDRDPDAVEVAKNRLKGLNAKVFNLNFTDFNIALKEEGKLKFDGMLLDLGVSSYQLDNKDRGFSFHNDAPLDMRMSKSGVSAKDLVNNLSEEELAKIFFTYGEEKFSRKIAKEIVKKRPLNTTLELADVISQAVPAAAKRDGHPARRVFQALRIAVNGELDCVEKVIGEAFEKLNLGGRIAIITFHSLEDRIVKKKFAELCEGCTCPPDFPVCVCHKKPKAKLVSKKPILPTEEEIRVNPRSRSAKLRVLEKISED